MSKLYTRTISTLSALLLFVLLGGPQLAQAWSMPQQNQQQQGAAASSNVPPSTALPDAPSTDQQQLAAQQSATQDQQPPANGKKKKEQTPLGAAAAPGAATAGGAASRPAGMALAPANQKQHRSLLIKIGLIAAGAAALGTVFALSHSTSSVPPGSGR
jgi:hypothetical protein